MKSPNEKQRDKTIDPLLSRRQAGEMMGVSEATIRRAEQSGRLKVYRFNCRRLRYRLSDLERLINEAGS